MPREIKGKMRPRRVIRLGAIQRGTKVWTMYSAKGERACLFWRGRGKGKREVLSEEKEGVGGY